MGGVCQRMLWTPLERQDVIGLAALTPPPQDPPHGKDPHYWIDVGKIIYVPDGELAPANTVQIGPNMYCPAPDPTAPSTR
jgi:hypothetical protein